MNETFSEGRMFSIFQEVFFLRGNASVFLFEAELYSYCFLSAAIINSFIGRNQCLRSFCRFQVLKAISDIVYNSIYTAP